MRVSFRANSVRITDKDSEDTRGLDLVFSLVLHALFDLVDSPFRDDTQYEAEETVLLSPSLDGDTWRLGTICR